jgi:uncharacterized protein (DUF58 family)
MIDFTLLQQLDRFDLIIRKRVTSSFFGQRKSVYGGRGVLFKDYRMYSPGDDFRAIDWKVFARTDDLYVKNYEEEKNLSVHIIIDSSASMDFGKPLTKFDYASMLGVGFAYLATKDNEKFQFATFSDKLDIFQSRRGMNQLASMMTYLNGLKPSGAGHLEESINRYKRLITSRSLIIFISDLLYPLEEIKNCLFTLGVKKSDLKVIQVLDKTERDMGLTGDMRLQDLETGDKIHTYISPRLRLHYKGLLEQHNAEIEKHCMSMNADYHLITNDTPFFDAFYTLLR